MLEGHVEAYVVMLMRLYQHEAQAQCHTWVKTWGTKNGGIGNENSGKTQAMLDHYVTFVRPLGLCVLEMLLGS
jgi:hypothetical protein